MEIDAFVRGFLATYFVLIAVFYNSKQRASFDRDGDDRVYYGGARSAQRNGRRAFNAFRAAILVAVMTRAAFPEIDPWLGPFVSNPEGFGAIGALSLLGTGLMIGGVWIALYAHNYMGALWRSGTPTSDVESVAPAALLQKGPFSRTRNPIFCGVLIAQIGFFLAFPSVFTALCLAVGGAVLIRQTRIEEADLAERFGGSYRAYAARTPRWI